MTSSGKNIFGEYYLGLDVGTSSVGWCVTDVNYNVLKAKGKAMLGVRLFDAAESAADRRLHRCSRRRLRRRNWRVKLVRDIFKSEIEKVDPYFFTRLDESKFLKEDKNGELKDNTPEGFLRFTLFANPDSEDGAFRTDRDFYREYPTIYHLRVALMKHGRENDGRKYDIRLYYLVISHFMKHRGYFFQELGETGKPDFGRIFEDFRSFASEGMQVDFEVKEAKDVETIKTILCDNVMRCEDKEKKIIKLMDLSSDAQKEAIRAISGSKFDLSKLFDDTNIKKTKKSFETLNIDELKSKDENRFDNKRIGYLEKLQSVYICSRYDAHKDGCDTISEAQVARYEKHRRNLEDLRKVVRKYCPEKYDELFSSADKDNSKKIDYIKSLKSEDWQDDESLLRIKNELKKTDANQFFPTQNNSFIPYRLHLDDLERILDALVKDYPIFKDDSDEYSACERILKTFTFQIPYYVGPLNAHENKNCNNWMIRKKGEEKEKVYPWNFDKIVDRERSAEEFLNRLLKDCQKLSGKKVIPKNSLLYSKYMVLNELNNIRIDNDRIPVDKKIRIYEEFFKGEEGKRLKTKRIKLNDLKKWLILNNIIFSDQELSGVVDDTFQSSLKSYHDFKEIIGEKVDTDPLMVEEMIRDILVFGNDRSILRKRIKRDAKNRLNDEQIDRITNLSYSGWGSFSSEFLDGVKNEEGYTIIDALLLGNENLEELMSQKHSFRDNVNDWNKSKTIRKQCRFLSYTQACEIAKRFYPSPSVKRSVWQALLIVNEIRKICGSDPSRIFIEFAREKEKNRQGIYSRKQRFLELYNSILKDSTEYSDQIGEMIKFINGIEDERRFRAKKLFLYLTQMGKDIYSGNPINPNDLLSGAYNIDHIVPQSIKKDDSIVDNLVLTSMNFNQDEKKALYPIEGTIVNKQKKWWSYLKKYNLISEEKYNRLIRTSQLSEDEKVGFINRQLVETRQSTKLLKELLEFSMPASRVFCTKAGLVSEFRKDNCFWKSRLINDYHHAKDAYLNIVVGNVYATKFDFYNYSGITNLVKSGHYSLKMESIFRYKVDNGIISYDTKNADKYIIKYKNGNVVAWQGGENGTISLVRKIMQRNDILFTRYATKKSRKGNGFWDQNPLSKRDGNITPLKTSDERYSVNKHGGYRNNYCCFMLVESGENNRRKRSLERIPVSLCKMPESKILVFLQDKKGANLKKPNIILPVIKLDSLLKVNGVPVHISGSYDKNNIRLKNAVQLCVDPEIENIIHRIECFVKKYSNNSCIKLNESYDHISKEDIFRVYHFLIHKIDKKIYKSRLPLLIPDLVKFSEKDFTNLESEKQCKIIIELIKIFSCKSEKIDLKDIKIKKEIDRVISKNISSNFESVKLIYQSITGLFEREIDLLTVKADK